MALTNRSAEILRLVRSHGSCRINDLAAELGVSDETIRRNIRPLVDRGMVLKVHGGIMLPERAGELPFHNRMQENRAAKEQIAALAAQQINSGDSLILDGGTTTSYVALALTGHRDLQTVTNSTDIARTLAPHGNNRIHVAGGELRADDGATFGDPAGDFVRRFHARHAILSIAAINAWGFLNQNPCESEFARTVMAQSERVIVVADHSKFGRDGFVKVADHQRIDVLITDIDPPASLAKRLTDADVEILVADPGGVRATA
ncbi:MAG: DeoR/GlpR family DNA-binding transcription regulator [Halofilum sp. (in: g-proteobacteria)]